jgi:hypothetical protein
LKHTVHMFQKSGEEEIGDKLQLYLPHSESLS